ncbi:ABC1 kinase family protein [Salibacterium halotolerans]|uniref:Ubiquinone biosynthesis protein n=1 Tax=Salibacterium halotolerans TaxID=1884432 RepID=A0A1I5QAD9_9BACI|nr:AarF/ABC1/UbiB kinase family protein [Salibacterium halotolerans]SFP43193.1 ubiquinone biosynthesis protein [Salibacterium halotolerans]
MEISRGLKHANRYRKIAATLARHGFGYVLQEVGLFHILSLPKRMASNPDDYNMHSMGQRIRKVLEDLGPTFIKLGQMISTREDIFPPSIIEELQKLQDEVPPFPFEQARKIIEHDLGHQLEDVFASFSDEPIAAASIGQVYKAELHDGTDAAVKVSRPHIKETIEKDIDILRDLAKLFAQRFQWARYYQLQDVIEEYIDAIRDEVDYYVEARNTEKMRTNMENFPALEIPEVFESYSSRRVLTISFLDGTKISELEQSDKQFNKKALARSLTDAFFHQVMVDGFFHSDPHPGNIVFTGYETAGLIDFGQIGRLNKEMRRQFINYIIAMTRKKPDQVADAIYEMADIPDTIDHDQFAEDVYYMLSKYYEKSFQDIRFGEAINDIFATSHRYEIQIYKEYTMLAKALITFEGIIEHLDPDLSIVEIAEPYGKKLAMEQINPKNIARDWWKEGVRQRDYLLDIPREFRDALSKLNKSHVGIEMKVPKMNIFLNKLDRISNRLSFSIILLAFSIIMVGLIVGSTFGDSSSPLVRLPVIEISFIISFLMFLWLLYAIFKSGRF